MLSTDIKASLRILYREKTYALINLSGLSLAIACCLILGLYLRDELTYDRHHEKHRQIFRIANEFTTSGSVDRIAFSSISLGPMLKENYPEIKDYVRLQPLAFNQKISVKAGEGSAQKEFYWSDIYAAEKNIFNVFTHKILYGDPKTGFNDINSAAISESFARKYFGDGNPIGKIILMDLAGAGPKKVTVVFRDLPENTHLKYSVLLPMQNLPPNIPPRELLFGVNVYTYLVMPENYDPDRYKTISSSFYSRYMDDRGKLLGITWKSWLQPLADIHLYSDVGYDLPTGNRYYVYGFAAVAAFILLIACINYVNLATARAARRAKEIGMRKLLGSSRLRLILRFQGEAIIFSLIAMGAGIALVKAALRFVATNDLFGKALSLNLLDQPILIFWVLGLSLLVGILSGFYPALYLSSISPLSSLVGSQRGRRGSVRFRELLVLAQFTVSVIVIASTLIMALQMHYISSKPMGFEKENRLVIKLRGLDVIEKYQVMKTELLKNSRILGVSQASAMISTDQVLPLRAPMVDNKNGVQERLVASNLQVSDDFLDVMGMRMVAGRDFTKRLLTDFGTAFLVNETMVKSRGWADPLGKKIQMDQFNGRVIGVIKDFHFRSLHNTVEPLIINQLQDNFQNIPATARGAIQRVMVLKISDADVSQTLRFLQEKFSKYDPRHPFEYAFLDDSIANLYLSEKRLMKMTGIFSGVCIFISCLGLFGLASFATEQRSKEIGIRKVLGASVFQIIFMLSRRILLLVFAAAVIATVITWFAINEWLSGFAYRVGIQPGVFVLATVGVMAVAFITVALQSYKTAQTKPARTLRYE